jgi:uncharacterized membrane protein
MVAKKNLSLTTRLEALVDAVFAIAMTLLVLKVEIPEIAPPITEALLREQLISLWPSLYSFAISFLLLAVYWNIHRKQLSRIRYANDGLTWINLWLLLFVALIPFSTEVVANYTSFSSGALIFNFNLLFLGLIFYWQWSYAGKNNLLEPNVALLEKKATQQKIIVFIFITFLAIGLSFILPEWSTLVYLSMPLALRVLERKTKKKKS